MTDEIREQISVFIDDELSAEECEFFVRRLQRDPGSRGHYLKYQLIGAAIRGELGQSDQVGELRRRLRAALDGTGAQTLAAPEARTRTALSRLLKPVLGVGIAAGVTVVAVLGLRLSSGLSGISAAGVQSLPLDARLELLEPPSYVVPLPSPRAPLITPPIRLTNYLMHHGGVSSYLNRTSVHSNVVSGPAEVDDTAEDELQ